MTPPLTGTSPTGLIALSTVLPILCIIATLMRFNLRWKQKVGILPNDWMIVPAVLFYIGMCICALLGVHRRVWGYPTPYDENLTNPVAYNNDGIFESELVLAFQFVQILALGTIKLSALLFYYRIFCTEVRRNILHAIIVTFIVITVLWTVAMTLMNGLQCGTHITALWNDDYLTYCIYVYPFEEGFAISNFLLDLFIILIPVPKLWTLHLPTARKIAVTGVFSFALVGLAGSIARMVSYLQLAASGPDTVADFRLEDTESIFWSNLEAGLGFLAVNLPPLWAYTNRWSAERVLRSARSLISLHSNRSAKGSRGSRSNSNNADGIGPFAGHGSQVEIVASAKEESHDMDDMSSRPTNGIRMQSSIIQNESAV